MARMIDRLSPLAVRDLGPGLHPDGGGLYLLVRSSGARSWVYRFMLNGKAREMGLGPVHTVPLAEARKRARAARLNRLDGIDPIAARHGQRLAAVVATARTITFKECADAYLKAHRAEWKSPIHRRQWETTLATYVFPTMAALPVSAIDVGLLLRVLEPIWLSKPETASRVRGRIESILGWAGSHGYRDGLNPARWKDHLENLLPRRSRVRQVAHHAALPYDEISAFLAALRGHQAVAARALELGILTATRTSEFLLARWGEVDLGNRVWTIPADRMKARREHRVPLAPAAIALLEALAPGDVEDFVFRGGGELAGPIGKPLSNMAALMLLRRMGRGDLTVHGFRSTFRDWAAERTNFPAEVAEMALAHTIADKVEAAYRRGDLFDKRRQLMEAWARFCSIPAGAGATITPLRRIAT